MLKAFSKIFIVLTMLLAFVGQVMANYTIISCESSTNLDLTVKHSEKISHIDFNNNTNETAIDCCDDDCCSIACVCTANSFTPTKYLNTEIIPFQFIIFNQAIPLQKLGQPKSISTSRFRPPIFTS